MDGVRATLPHLDRPLDRMRVAFDGDRAGDRRRGQRLRGVAARRCSTSGWASWPARVVRSRRGRPGRRRRRQRPGRRTVPTTGVSREPRAQRLRLVRRGDAGRAGLRREAEARAEQCYREALALDPGLAAARTNLGSLAYRRGDVAAAREAFEAALAIDPDQPEARFNLANLVLEAGDLELAVAEFRRVLADRARLRRRPLQPGGRARAPGRTGAGARAPRALPDPRADDQQLGRTGPHADRPTVARVGHNWAPPDA